MAPFAYDDIPHPVRPDLREAHRGAWAWLAQPGCWWAAAEKVAIARELRDARARRGDPPWLRRDVASSGGELPPAAVAAVRRIALEAHRLDRDWCADVVEQLGDGPYVELVAVAVCTTAIDAFAEALGAALEPLPEPLAGEPSRERPENVGDGGAWVPMAVPWQGPNVARALSLVPPANAAFFSLVGPMYAGGDFTKLVWEGRPLSRPQVELMASRVSAVNECFY